MYSVAKLEKLVITYETLFWQFLHPLTTILGPGQQPLRKRRERTTALQHQFRSPITAIILRTVQSQLYLYLLSYSSKLEIVFKKH